MKHLLITTIAAVLLVGCGEVSNPEPLTAKAPGISIHRAAKYGKIEAIKQHLANGADVNTRDNNKWTPLHYAAYYGHKVVAELLIAEGADVNAKDGLSGETPLHDAAYGGHKEIAELLIANGADVNAKSESKNGLFKGRTPLDSAEYNPEIANLLHEHGGKTKKELEAAGN